jgi:predicted metal-dependent enzyme (double-stranded beta helix superfamily)
MGLQRLSRFVGDLAALVEGEAREPELLRAGGALLGDLVRHDDWLPDAFAEPDPVRYRQYLLYCDPAKRFSVVSFVWGPGQSTPIHDHTVWGLVGVLRGAELSQRFSEAADGSLAPGAVDRLGPGQVEALSPAEGDVHQVSNAFADRVSVSIHVYGADIGAVSRSTYEPSGAARPFVSGYSNARVPDLSAVSSPS